MISDVKVYVFFYWCYLGDHVRLWLCLYVYSLREWCMVISYLTIWVYDGHINDVWLCIGWLKDDNGYFYVLIEWHVICVKVKYVVSCLGWLVSVTWGMYECEYEMSRLRILNPLSVVCTSDIIP